MAAQRRGNTEVGCAHNGRARERCFKLPNECSANTDNAEEEKNGRKRKEEVRSVRFALTRLLLPTLAVEQTPLQKPWCTAAVEIAGARLSVSIVSARRRDVKDFREHIDGRGEAH